MEVSHIEELLPRYYKSPAIRGRICEFLGAADVSETPAAYIVGTNGYSDYGPPTLPNRLPEYLEAGWEVDRSLWDRDSLIADIDLEYHNFDFPATPWLDPERAFALQQPVLDATLGFLAERGIAPLVLMSGRGYHLVWAIHRESQAFRRLIQLGRVAASLVSKYAQIRSPGCWSIEPDLGRAFAGLGLTMEFVGHHVLAASRKSCALPVQPAAIEVGPGTNGREIVSFDLSEYGDPLHTRHIRFPFSAYLKPRQMQWALGDEVVRGLLPIFEIPLAGMTATQAVATARDPKAVLELSRTTSVKIPDASDAANILIDAYEDSALAAFHQRFYEPPWGPPAFAAIPASKGGRTVRIPGAPPCVEWILEHPNDWLLKPAALQHVARVLTALDWPPLAIAQLICRCYRTDCNWGDLWTRLDPSERAIFYTRLFTGMIATGVDPLIDLNCVSHREKGFCQIPRCNSNLLPFRDALLKRS